MWFIKVAVQNGALEQRDQRPKSIGLGPDRLMTVCYCDMHVMTIDDYNCNIKYNYYYNNLKGLLLM